MSWEKAGPIHMITELLVSVTFMPSALVFQITYFSLWYFNKQNQQRWIDLEKPLKKQLDKYGQEPTVYFGVVFYVPSVIQLQQEITRWCSMADLKWLVETFNTASWDYFCLTSQSRQTLKLAFLRVKPKWLYIKYLVTLMCVKCFLHVLSSLTLCWKRNVTVSPLHPSVSADISIISS